MQPASEILSFMDLLDLDEEVIDARVKTIMERKTFTNEHLVNLINLLQYKQLINAREDGECDNNMEYNFIGKVILNTTDDNVDIVCKIIKLVLILHPSSIINKSEHLIQQLLSDMYLPPPKIQSVTDTENEKLHITLLQLKICVSILEAVLLSNNKLSLPFLDISLEYIVFSKYEKLQVYFLTHAVSRFFETIMGYNILDRIWNLLKQSKDVGEIILKVLSCLSNYYLPVADSSGNILYESDVIFHSEFWDLILFGLNKEIEHRKKSIYLAKRAIDCVLSSNKSVNITSKSTFIWGYKNKTLLKKMWDNYFILIDSLEEKQSNIVLPSLKLFDTLQNIGFCWLNCAFNIGLCHDNAQVRFQSLQYRLQYQITSEPEAMSVLEAINDLNLFEHVSEYNPLKNKIKNIIKNSDTLINILKVAPLVKWSPVPLYHLTTILSDIYIERIEEINPSLLMDVLSNLLKIKCNNIIIRKAIHINISHFIGNNCKKLSWKEYMNLYPHLHLDMSANLYNPFTEFIKNELLIPDTKQFLQLVSFSYINIEFVLKYYEGHGNSEVLQFIDDIINKMRDICSREYSNKNECINDAVFVVQLYKRSIHKKGVLFDQLNINASSVFQTIIQFVSSLLRYDIIFDIEKIALLFDGLDHIQEINNTDRIEYLLQLYKSALLLLSSNHTHLEKKVLSIYVINTCLKCSTMLEIYKQELLHLDVFMDMVINVQLNESVNKEDSGRLRNIFYEKSCEISYFSINNTQCVINKNILEYIQNVLDRGGYGCLKWILKIVNKIIPTILDNKEIKFDVPQFLDRVWKEIEDLKSNSQYNACIQQFVIIITQDELLKQPAYNNIVILYANKILEYAACKSAPLYYLVKQMNKINISFYSHLVYILSDILLYAFVPKKDHRIAESVSVEILQDSKYAINRQDIFFNSHIKVLSACILSKIVDPEILNTIMCFIIKKVEELFKNKQRYYGNSQHERSLQAAGQNLLFIFLKCRKVNLDNVLIWVMDFLGRIPHQPYVRTCLEWYIALNYYLKGNIINDQVLNQLKAKNVSIQSQFMILYWVVTHKIKIGVCMKEEFEYVMDFLLSNIMGPIYSIRLYAQYLSARIYERNNLSKTVLDSQKYSHTVNVINKTLEDAVKTKDKSFLKLMNDHFVHVFDIVEDLTPCAIFWSLPQLYDSHNNDIIETDFLENSLKEIDGRIIGELGDKFFEEWIERHKCHTFKTQINLTSQDGNKESDNLEETQTIQKKYVPWKNMNDIDVHSNEKKKDKSDLIVVASLIDKLPNLGGMARTSEVFGVKTYVVDSIRHLQDKQFQGLSVSAERWIDVDEVRPGRTLNEYLMMKKTEGYSIVAAEQTSSSTQLQNFRFPKKTLLLLGHEKEGVPCDLLPLMDHCVEIPQQGVIRSLNVHVTAAIFIWEYARQNML